MPEPSWRVAIIDSGIDPQGSARASVARRFVDCGTQVLEREATGDATGHGSQIAAIIASADRPIDLIVAQVMGEDGRSTAAIVAAAIEWALIQRAGLIHLSLGLRDDRPVLAAAVAAAIAAGSLVVASTPARGVPSYPAAYPGVIRATGDARCKQHEISRLATAQADFGGCVTHVAASGRTLRGASIGAAHLSRFIVSRLSPHSEGSAVHRSLSQLAVHAGPERRSV